MSQNLYTIIPYDGKFDEFNHCGQHLMVQAMQNSETCIFTIYDETENGIIFSKEYNL